MNRDMTTGDKTEILKNYNSRSQGTYLENNGIVFTDFGDGRAEGEMPVDRRTCRFDGKIIGGANIAFAETLAGWLGIMNLPEEKQGDLYGISVSANHIHQTEDKLLKGHAEFIHKGRTTQVVRVEIRDTGGKLLSICTITNLIKY